MSEFTPTKAAAAGLSSANAYLLLAFVVFVWGVNWPLMKIGLGYMPPGWLAVCRMGLSTLCFFALFAFRWRLPLPQKGDGAILFTLSVFQMAGAMGFSHLAMLYVDPGRSAILAHTHPLWAAPMAYFVLREKLSLSRFTGLALGLAGVVVLFNPLTLDWSAEGVVIGHVFLLCTALSMAISLVHMRRHHWVSSPLELMPWAMLGATVLLFVLSMVFEDTVDITWSGELMAILAFNGLLVGALGFWAYISAARSLPTNSTALGLLATPVIGLVSSALLLSEPLTADKIAGLVFIAGGVTLVTVRDLWRRAG